MQPFQSILAIVDPTATQHPAVDKAALLARQFSARLELYVCDTRAARESRLAPGSAQKPVHLKAFLEALAAPLRERGIDVATETDAGDPFLDHLIGKVRCTGADLVVKDTHHHSLARRTFLTNTDWELIRACPVPLLLVKETSWAISPRIIAAVDPGHVNDKPALLDESILACAAMMSEKLGGELHALHAYIPVEIIASAVGVEPPSALTVSAEQLKKEQQRKLRDVNGLLGPFQVQPEHVHVELGGPAQLLPHTARRLHADVMVMGAIARSGVQRAFIGSTAEDVLEHLPCDALIVKPPDFAAALQGMGL